MSELEAIKILEELRQPLLVDTFSLESLNKEFDAEAFEISQKRTAYSKAISALWERHARCLEVQRKTDSSDTASSDEKKCRMCGSKDGTVVNDLCNKCFENILTKPNKTDAIINCLELFATVTVPLVLIAILIILATA